MYCVKCGKEIDDSVKFCPACGQKVGKKVDSSDCTNSMVDGVIDVKEYLQSWLRNTDALISAGIMIIAIKLCLEKWFHLPSMGDYTPLEWHEFIENCSYYLSEKVYNRANAFPASAIWVNLPLVLYVWNLIHILKNKKNCVGLEIAGFFSSVFILGYAQYLYIFYDRYVLLNYSKCTLSTSFYFMMFLVFIDMLRDTTKKNYIMNEKKQQNTKE